MIPRGGAKLREVVRFEIAYQLHRKSILLFIALFLLMLMGQVNGQSLEAASGGVMFNAPLLVARNSALMTMIALFIIAGLAGDAATRDIDVRLEALMHAAPIGRMAYLGGRVVGAFIVGALVLLAVPVMMLLAPIIGLQRGPAHAIHAAVFLQSYFIIIVPTVFVATVLLFSLATLVRHGMGSYVGAALTAGWSAFCLVFLGGRLKMWDAARLLDPIGIAPLSFLDRTWSPIDAASRMIGSDHTLLLNRALWLVVAFAVLSFTYSRFRFGGYVRRSTRVRANRPPEAIVSVSHAPIVVSRNFGAVTHIRQTAAVVRDSLREIASRWNLLFLPYLWLLFAVAQEGMEFQGTPVIPTTERVLAGYAGAPPPVKLAIFLLTLLFAGELVWRERDARMQSLTDTAPVPTWSMIVGKTIGLCIGVIVFQAMLVAIGIGVQLARGAASIDLLLYAKTILGLQLAGPLTFALFAVSIHVVASHKQVGHVLGVMVALAPAILGSWLHIEHPMLIPLNAPGIPYSTISGFDPFLAPFLWFKGYWAAWVLLFAVCACLLWARGAQNGLRDRIVSARSGFDRRTLAAILITAPLALIMTGFVYYNTNVLNEYTTSSEQIARRVRYERQYKRYESLPMPVPRTIDLDVDIQPALHAARVRGTYSLHNATNRAIDTVVFSLSPDVSTGDITFDRAARVAVKDDTLGERVYVLSQPLMPGDDITVKWSVAHEPRGFTGGTANTAVVHNGSVLPLHDWMPTPGYSTDRELDDAAVRKTHGLPPRPGLPAPDDPRAQADASGTDRISLTTTITTAAGQLAVAPGKLRSTSTRDGRSTYRYETDAPVSPGFSLFSARYAVTRASQGNVEIEIIHDPTHTLNVPRMIESVKLSLDQYAKRFGPYENTQFRMIEYPSEGGSLHATTGSIWYQEVFSMFDPAHDERSIDLPFAVVAHEAAHQFQPARANAEGAALMSESFAWYAALGVIEARYGAEHLERFLDFMREDYLKPRSRADVPLIRAADAFLGYRKGPFAMYALWEYIGQERVDAAWRRVREEHSNLVPPLATSLDVLRELRAVTPDSLQALLSDLLERNTFWDLETKNVSARRTDHGTWIVDIDVAASKSVVDAAGHETAMPMNDLTEIGVYAAPDSAAAANVAAARGRQIYRAMRRIRSGTQRISVEVGEKPYSAGIDPRHLLIDVTPVNNVAHVTENGAALKVQ